MLRKSLSALLGLFLFLGGAVLLSSCGQQSSSGDTVTIGHVTWVGYTPAYVAQQQGYFEEAGLNVEFKVIDDVAALKSAFISGQVDMVFVTADMALPMIDDGADLEVVYAVDVSDGAEGLVVYGIDSWADLKGKTVAGETGLPPMNLLLYMMGKEGLNFNDIEWKEMLTPNAAIAFRSGQVDAAAVYEPFLSTAADRDGAKIMITSADEPYSITDYLAVLKKNTDAERANIKKFITAWDKGVTYLKANKQEAINIAAQEFAIDAAEVADMFTGIIWPSLAENKELFDSSTIPDKFSIFSKAMTDAEIISGEISAQSVINTSFVQ